MKRLKYPALLFFALLLAKLAYIGIESYYNYHVMTVTTSPSLSTETVESLNERGHWIASFGITLLLMPLFFFFVKKRKPTTIYLGSLIFFIFSLVGVYHLLTWTVDRIVEKNQDKRFNAYYVNIFKYGLLNRWFYYDSFIDRKRLVDNALTVDDRIVLVNTFLILYADPDLIEALRQKGREQIANLYIDQYRRKDYENYFGKFVELSEELKKNYEAFEAAKRKVRQKIDAKAKDAELRKKYEEMMETLDEKYRSYTEAYAKLDSVIEEATSFKKLGEYKEKLARYFRYRGYDRAEQMYAQMMQEKFHHYVEPERWLNDSGDLTEYRIMKVIEEELKKRVRGDTGLPPGLTKEKFLSSMAVKRKLAKALKKEGVRIPKDFDYRFETFKRCVLASKMSGSESIEKRFKEELEKRIGPNDLTLQTTWREFVYSDYVTRKLREKLKKLKLTHLEPGRIQSLLVSGKLGDFREKLFVPLFEKKIAAYLFDEKAFYKNPKAIEYGDKAIKLLYIPPIAMALSMLALLLNIVTVVGMVLTLLGFDAKIRMIWQTTLFVIILFFPFTLPHTIENGFLQNAERFHIDSRYGKFLHWLSFWESVNYRLQESLHNAKT